VVAVDKERKEKQERRVDNLETRKEFMKETAVLQSNNTGLGVDVL
jgi:hypothetical protein